jgi:rRNA biogenesis protein RRP5
LNGFREGDAVRAKIVKIDMEKGKINFGIKPKYFSDNEEEEDEDEEEDDEDEEEDDEEENGLELKSDDEDEEALDGEMDEDDEGEDDDEEEEEEEDEDVDVSRCSRLQRYSLTNRSTCLANLSHPKPSLNPLPNPPHPL